MTKWKSKLRLGSFGIKIVSYYGFHSLINLNYFKLSEM